MRKFIFAAIVAMFPMAANAANILDVASTVYRDYVTDGVPTSGTWNPSKSDIRSLWSSLASALPGLSTNVGGTTSIPGLDGGKWIILDNVYANSGAFAAPTLRVDRHTHYTGGTGVSNAIWANCSTEGPEITFEWCVSAAMDNFSTAGNNSAFSAQIRRNAGAGPSWAATTQAIDMSGVANPTTELVSLEVDIDAAGTDTNKERHGINIVLGRKSSVLGGTAEATVHAASAISIGPFFPTDTGGTAIWDTLIDASGYAGDGINLSTVNFTGYSLKLPGFTVAGNTYGTLNIGATHFGAPGTADGEKIQLLGTPGTLSAGDYSIGVGAGELWINTGANIGWYVNGSKVGGASGAGLNIVKRAASSAPGAGLASLIAVAGTTAGTCKIQALAGTSSTPVTIIDNVGTGC